MKNYRVAVIGCGPRGTAAADAYDAHPRSTVVGLCDLEPERLRTLADSLRISARFSDDETMVRETRPDIVVIATRNEQHHEQTMRVLELGVHVDVEKPFCLELHEGDAILARAAAQGVRVAVHHQWTVGVFMRPLLRMVGEGRIGRLHHIAAACKGYYGGYGLMDIGCHFLMNMARLAGKCQGVTALGVTGGRHLTPGGGVRSPDAMGRIAAEFLTAPLHLGRCVTATLLHHRLPKVGQPPLNSVMELVGTEGRLLWQSGGAWFLPHGRFVPNGAYDRWEPVAMEAPPSYQPGGRVLIDDYCFVDEYINALDEGRDHVCGGAAALHALEIMMGAFESAASGVHVELPQAKRDHPLRRWRREKGYGEAPPVPRRYWDWLAVEDRRIDVSHRQAGVQSH